ncbi:MAG: DNA/RNA nuclease SfsA [Ruminococcaceae bacterium]|nr:DNA/RNA nuclease SfsA [Oscillospiraceae bacterium]
MKYKNIKEGMFLSRPNRFIAYVNIEGKEEVCHVKNTGRCKELLIPGVKVYLEESDNKDRKTKYDLVSVMKGEKLFNIDSSAPNKVFGEWAINSGYFGNITYFKPECKYKNSRFDFYMETDEDKIFAEVKGVTLEKDGVLMFPDAPTQRGVKHLRELIECTKEGYKAYAVFVIQTDYAKYFTPNSITHPEFAEALSDAKKSGVNILCVTCDVSDDKISIKEQVKVVL